MIFILSIVQISKSKKAKSSNSKNDFIGKAQKLGARFF